MSGRPPHGASAGSLLTTKFSIVHVWDEDLDDALEELRRGAPLIVLGAGNPRRPKRLNPDCYLKVLTPGGRVGWIHIDNCTVVE